jgi:hypothetical protein
MGGKVFQQIQGGQQIGDGVLLWFGYSLLVIPAELAGEQSEPSECCH